MNCQHLTETCEAELYGDSIQLGSGKYFNMCDVLNWIIEEEDGKILANGDDITNLRCEAFIEK